MSLAYQKSQSIRLNDAGYDEKWLQQLILDDPSILGIGDLVVIQRERQVSSGGRLDFLMSDPETNTMYEVEIMLGKLDESHIIRSIEYWDIERRRWPTREHRAVIVAEEITNRFFNVISLFNRSIPIIALQLEALQIGEHLALSFTKVIDIFEPREEDAPEVQGVDRNFWVQRSNPKAIQIVDKCVEVVTQEQDMPRLTYNRSHIALGGSKYNYCWFRPRKVQSHCHIVLRAGDDNLILLKERLESIDVDVSLDSRDRLRVLLRPEDIANNRELIAEVLITARDAQNA